MSSHRHRISTRLCPRVQSVLMSYIPWAHLEQMGFPLLEKVPPEVSVSPSVQWETWVLLSLLSQAPAPETQQLLFLSGTLVPKRPLTSATSEGSLCSRGTHMGFDHVAARQRQRGCGPGNRAPSAASPPASRSLQHRLQPPPERRQHQRPARACPFSFLFIAGSAHGYRSRSPQSNLLAESLPESSLKPSCKNSFECK